MRKKRETVSRKFKKNLFFYLIMFIILLLVFELILSIGGYFYFYVYSNLENPKIDEDAFRILFLGESTTRGIGSQRVEDVYPAQVEKILQQKYPNKKIRSYNKGLGGIDTTAILRNLDRNMIKYKPHLVILMAGQNEHCLNTLIDTQSVPNNTLESKQSYSKSKIYRLINLIKDIPKLSLVVGDDRDFKYVQDEDSRGWLKYPAIYMFYYPYKLSSYSPSQVISNLNAIIQVVQSYDSEIWFAGYLEPGARRVVNPVLKKIAEENNTTYVGNYPEVNPEINRSLFACDGWHPSEEGHKIIAEKIAEKIIDKGIVDR